ncbi:MAG TPA: QueT transporter family protein, partial [Bacillota bacterium]
MPWTRRSITRAGLIAATYAVITIALAPISYGPIQVRLSEALTLLPFYWGT